MFKLIVMQYQIVKSFLFFTAEMLMKGEMNFIYILMKHSTTRRCYENIRKNCSKIYNEENPLIGAIFSY